MPNFRGLTDGYQLPGGRLSGRLELETRNVKDQEFADDEDFRIGDVFVALSSLPILVKKGTSRHPFLLLTSIPLTLLPTSLATRWPSGS